MSKHRSYNKFDDTRPESVRVFPFELTNTEQVKLFDEPLTAEPVGDSYFLMATTTGILYQFNTSYHTS